MFITDEKKEAFVQIPPDSTYGILVMPIKEMQRQDAMQAFERDLLGEDALPQKGVVRIKVGGETFSFGEGTDLERLKLEVNQLIHNLSSDKGMSTKDVFVFSNDKAVERSATYKDNKADKKERVTKWLQHKVSSYQEQGLGKITDKMLDEDVLSGLKNFKNTCPFTKSFMLTTGKELATAVKEGTDISPICDEVWREIRERTQDYIIEQFMNDKNSQRHPNEAIREAIVSDIASQSKSFKKDIYDVFGVNYDKLSLQQLGIHELTRDSFTAEAVEQLDKILDCERSLPHRYVAKLATRKEQGEWVQNPNYAFENLNEYKASFSFKRDFENTVLLNLIHQQGHTLEEVYEAYIGNVKETEGINFAESVANAIKELNDEPTGESGLNSVAVVLSANLTWDEIAVIKALKNYCYEKDATKDYYITLSSKADVSLVQRHSLEGKPYKPVSMALEKEVTIPCSQIVVHTDEEEFFKEGTQWCYFKEEMSKIERKGFASASVGLEAPEMEQENLGKTFSKLRPDLADREH